MFHSKVSTYILDMIQSSEQATFTFAGAIPNQHQFISPVKLSREEEEEREREKEREREREGERERERGKSECLELL